MIIHNLHLVNLLRYDNLYMIYTFKLNFNLVYNIYNICNIYINKIIMIMIIINQ